MSLQQDIINRYGDLLKSQLQISASVATQDANPDRPGVQVTSDSALISIGGIKKGALAWIDTNGDMQFDAGDIPVTNGLVAVNNLQSGVNVINVLQSYKGIVSNPTQVVIERDTYLESSQIALDVKLLTTDANSKRDGVQVVSDTIRFDIGNVKNDGIAWLDLDRNGKFDSDMDIQVRNGEFSFHDIAFGTNTLYFYQEVRGVTSNPVVVEVDRDQSLEQVLEIQYADQLARLGVAFWGRPLTQEEFDIGMNYMKDTSGGVRSLVEMMLNSNEFLNHIDGSTNDDVLSKLSLVTNQLYGRGPTLLELIHARQDLVGTVVNLVFSPSGADSQIAGARALIAQYITNNEEHFSSLFPNQDVYHQVVRNLILQTTKANAQKLLVDLTRMANDAEYRPDAPEVLGKSVDYLVGHITFAAPKEEGAQIWLDLDRNATIDPEIDLLAAKSGDQYQVDVALEEGLNTFVAYTDYQGNLSDPTMIQLVGVAPMAA